MPATSVLIDLCDAIVKDLNSNQWVLGFKAERRKLPRYELSDHDRDTQVYVTPGVGGYEMTPASRSEWQVENVIDIGVLHKLTTEVERETDTLMALVDDIAEFYRTRRPTGINMPLAGIKVVPYSVNDLEGKNLYIGVVNLTFLEWRS